METWAQRHKTPAEVTREFENEKWAPLLERARKAPRLSLNAVDEWVLDRDCEVLITSEEEFVLLKAGEAHDLYRKMVAETLAKYLPATAVVEFGCGYGTVILDLVKRASFSGVGLIAGEYTRSGVELTRMLALAEQADVQVGRCDLGAEKITDLDIPENSIIFTSYAAHYIPLLTTALIASLQTFRPKAVVHFEPCYDLFDPTTLLGLMRKRYVEVNDYNRNLASMLREAQSRGAITILEEVPNRFGINPLLPASVIAWKPLQARQNGRRLADIL